VGNVLIPGQRQVAAGIPRFEQVHRSIRYIFRPLLGMALKEGIEFDQMGAFFLLVDLPDKWFACP
jgi:hypothetical protein